MKTTVYSTSKDNAVKEGYMLQKSSSLVPFILILDIIRILHVQVNDLRKV